MKDAENNDKRYKAELRDVSPLLVVFSFLFFLCVCHTKMHFVCVCVCERERDIGDR